MDGGNINEMNAVTSQLKPFCGMVCMLSSISCLQYFIVYPSVKLVFHNTSFYCSHQFFKMRLFSFTWRTDEGPTNPKQFCTSTIIPLLVIAFLQKKIWPEQLLTREYIRIKSCLQLLLLLLFRHSTKSSIAQEERLATSSYRWQGSTSRQAQLVFEL